MQKKPAGRGGTKRLGVDEQGQYYYKNVSWRAEKGWSLQ